MNDNSTVTCTEKFTAGIVGRDLPELRARAWDALSSALGTEQARDDVDAWTLTKLAAEPNDESQDGDNDKYAATAEFTRSEPAAASRL